MTTPTTETTTDRATILNALDTWIRQRPGLDYGNYASGWSDTEGRKAYQSEVRSIGRDLQDARTLLRAVERSGMPVDTLLGGFRAYSGRLTWDGTRLDYCTGQYWPTEYRKAVCAVLASALWDYHRDDYAATAHPGDALRAAFRRMFGRRMQQRWFD